MSNEQASAAKNQGASSTTATDAVMSSSTPAEFRIVLVSFLAAVIGLVSGLVAYALYKLIGFFTNLFFYHRLSSSFTSARFEQMGVWVILIPVIGGLIVGMMAKYGTSKSKGHGIPEAMEAVLVNRSRIEPRVALLKPLSAALAIGTGGPFGAEGPIIQTGGALGSLVGQILHTTAVERKTLLACGAAAGMSATFNTPIAGVIIAIELLMFEFKSRSFIPLVVASTLATEVHMQLLGPGPMFPVAAMDFGIPRALPFYLVLGVVCGLAAVALTKALYWVEDTFEKLPIDELWWPAIGALLLGVIGFFVPRVFGVGYDTIGGHPEWATGVETSAHRDGGEVCGAGDFARLWDFRRAAGPDISVELGDGRPVRDDWQSDLPGGSSFARRLRAGGDGGGVRGGVASDVYLHHICL